MISLLFFAVSLFSSLVGGICGIGGGIIIKPILDATGTMSVSSVSFLSGCTVLSMSLVTFLRNRNTNGIIEFKKSTALAAGSALGGFLGKMFFDVLKSSFHNENRLGAVQAGLLLIITFSTFLYSLSVSKIKTQHIENLFFCGVIGLLLGLQSSFLGIGGGPINLMVLSYFFSMRAKKAAANSLYIILFSQTANLLQTLVKRSAPPVGAAVLILMIFAGISGGLIGSWINKKISDKDVTKLFIRFMIVIIFVNIYNLIKFTTAAALF